MKREVSVVGGGVWGKALARTFAMNEEVLLYSLPDMPVDLKNPRVHVSYEIESLKETKYLFLVIPADAVRKACEDIKPILDDDCRIIICSKGMDSNSGLLMSEVVGEFFPKENIAVLSGPNFASEVWKGLPTITSIVTEDISMAETLAEKFTTDNFKLIPSTNLIMVQLFGTIKNVIAILCGASHGLELGENLRAAIVSEGIKEIMKLAAHKNASNYSLVLEPAGIGDIFLTCSSTTSRNNKFGQDIVSKYIGKNYKEIFSLGNITVEGVSTILALKKWNFQSPLMEFAYDLISAKYKSKKEIADNLQRIIFLEN
jgi:glycerol-3-phosphate dehydrogenase (NAD(P)+)